MRPLQLDASHRITFLLAWFHLVILKDLGIEADEYVWQMEAFRECWKRKGNDQRTQTKDA